MDRYLTRRYVAITWLEAIRLARLDGTPLLEIRCTRQVELIHRTDWWVWWSDERITTAIGLPDGLRPQELSPDAAMLISEIWESESPTPSCGWGVLAKVQNVIASEPLLHQKATYSSTSIERLTVETAGGIEINLYRVISSREDGYECNITTDLELEDCWSS